MAKLKLGYWNYHGYGTPIRLLLELAEADYEEETYPYEEKEKWFQKKENLGLLYPNVPYIEDQLNGKTIKMTEHLPIMRYIARKHGLFPKTEEELVVAEQTESFVYDLKFLFYRVAYGTKENFEKGKAEWIEYASKRLPYLNNLLANREYVTGKLSYMDVVLYDFLLLVNVFAPELLKENPNIARHFQKINSLPQIQNYRNGKGKGVWKERRIASLDAIYDGKF